MKISVENTTSRRIRDLEGGIVYRYQGNVYLKTGTIKEPCYPEYRTHPTASVCLSKNNGLDMKGNDIKQFNKVYWNEEVMGIEVCYDEIIGKMEIDL